MIKPPQNRTHLADWLDWLTLQHPQEIDLGLARVGEVAARLDVCRPAPFVITVAGTNGKGSSVAMLVAIASVLILHRISFDLMNGLSLMKDSPRTNS